jgi:hypothetical protein
MHKLFIGDLIDTMENIEYGIIIAIVIDVLLLLIIASINTKNKLNVLSYIIAGVLLVPLTFQMSRLIGACNISSTTSAINDIVGKVSPTLSKYMASATNNDIGWFVFRRVMWSLLFIGIAGFCIYATMDRKRTRIHDIPTGVQTGRKYISNTSRKRR